MQNDGRTGVIAVITDRPTKIAPNRGLAEIGIHLLETQLVGNKRLLAGGVDHDTAIDLADDSVGPSQGDAAGSLRGIQADIGEPRSVIAVRTELGGTVEQHFVELAPFHLPRRAAIAVVVLAKKERSRLGAAMRHELDALLRLPPRSLDPLDQPESLQRPIRFWHQRLADVETRHGSRSINSVSIPASANTDAGRTSGGSPANHHTVVTCFHDVLATPGNTKPIPSRRRTSRRRWTHAAHKLRTVAPFA